MSNEIKEKQVKLIKKSFHKIWFGLYFGRPGFGSEKLEGMTFLDLHVLGLAEHRQDLILKEIREYLQIPSTTLSSIVSKLEKQGLIKRKMNPDDLRTYSLQITDEGRELFKEHERIDTEASRKIAEALDEDERQEFVKLFEKIASEVGREKN